MKRSGFTLIEVLVVIAVIAILAALIVPRLLGAGRQARESILKANLKTIRSMLDAYELQQGKYPKALADLTTTKNKSSQPYLDEIPMDPITGLAEYDYDPETGEVHSKAEGVTYDDGTPYQDL